MLYRDVILFTLYLGFSLLAFYQLRLVYRDEQKFRLKFLSYYRNYLIFFFIYGFIKYVGYLFMIQFFYHLIDEAVLSLQIAMLIFPFFSITLYMMLLWIRNLAEKTIPKLLKMAYWSIQFAVFVFMICSFIIKQNIHAANSVQAWLPIHIAEVIILFAVIMQIFFLRKDLKINIKKQFIKNLGLIYVLSFGAFETYQNLSETFLGNDPLSYYALLSGLYFCINIPALFYMHHFLSNHHHELIDQQLYRDELDQFCEAYKITPREKEIIEMIIEGKSNQEIGKHLFISIQTVKNINYNIYKKINIKNRIQLLNLIQGFKDRSK